MIEKILDELSKTDFDFRAYANPRDPLAKLFPDWLPYYRLKFAIAKALQPRSILEIGVRFGYSAKAFLLANPDAKFVGIDLDAASFGGVVSALDWARKITANDNAEFIVGDSQQMERFPGGIYDLVHVDGQQDGIGTFHDLRRAVAQARWVLLDGYFWTRENFFNANDFLLKYKDVLQYALTIPGYAGELLLRVSDEYLAQCDQRAGNSTAHSSALADFYDTSYYLNDCGGYREFRQFGAERVTDPRLLSLLILSRLRSGNRALDLGCGRGEIAYQLASDDVKVTAIDYSADAIEIARRGLEGAPARIRNNVTLLCCDVGSMQSDELFDFAIAGDLIEHLSPIELDRLYASVAKHLSRKGVFVIHTAPNLWRYRRGYARRRALAHEFGAILPAEPRTRFELLMHINEQSPARLRRSLARFFPNVKVWVAGAADAAGSLSGKLGIAGLTNASDVYALASHAPLDLEHARTLLTSNEFSEGEHGKVSLRVNHWPEECAPGDTFAIEVTLTNRSRHFISSLPPIPTCVSYHWASASGDDTVVFDGMRSSISLGLAVGETRRVGAAVEAPPSEGLYLLTMTLVQEGRSWFEQHQGFMPDRKIIAVRAIAG